MTGPGYDSGLNCDRSGYNPRLNYDRLRVGVGSGPEEAILCMPILQKGLQTAFLGSKE